MNKYVDFTTIFTANSALYGGAVYIDDDSNSGLGLASTYIRVGCVPLLSSVLEPLKGNVRLHQTSDKSIFVFGSLEEMDGGGARIPRLDRCILSRWSLSYKTRLVAHLAKYCTFYSDISPKFSGKPENMQHRRPVLSIDNENVVV